MGCELESLYACTVVAGYILKETLKGTEVMEFDRLEKKRMRKRKDGESGETTNSETSWDTCLVR